jgi:hypothetical protein
MVEPTEETTGGGGNAHRPGIVTNGIYHNGGGYSDSPKLDLTRGKEMELFRRAVAQGWPIKEEDMKFYYQSLKAAAGLAIQAADAREIRGCVRTFVDIVGQVQSEEHHQDKTGRLDRGEATEIVVNYTSKDSGRFAEDFA